MPIRFYLNYGGPGGAWFVSENDEVPQKDVSSERKTIKSLRDAINEEYGPPHRKKEMIIDGISITVFTDGVHRSLLLELFPNADQRTKRKYVQAVTQAINFCNEDYSMLSHNCVKAVATVLHDFNKDITPNTVSMPWTFDNNLAKYCGQYEKNTTTGLFIDKYQTLVHQQKFDLFRKRHWTTHTINSINDIIKHAYGKTGGTGERTKSALLDLGWVIEDRNRLLRPTNSTPPDFQSELTQYNEAYEKVENLRRQYRRYAGFFPRMREHFLQMILLMKRR